MFVLAVLLLKLNFAYFLSKVYVRNYYVFFTS